MVVEEAPGVVESVYDAYNAVAIGFSFTGRLKDGFCHVAVYPHHVNLGFNRGVSLADPNGVLQGTGKSTRHIRFANESDLKQPFLRDYIRRAIAQVRGPEPESPAITTIVKRPYTRKRRPTKTEAG